MAVSLECLVQQIERLAGDQPRDVDLLIQTAATHARTLSPHDADLEPLIARLNGRLRAGPVAAKVARRRVGAFYTPPKLVDFILDHTLKPWLAAHPNREPTVLDPSCGTGRFLLAAGHRLAQRRVDRAGESVGSAWTHIGPLLRGLDTDPIATAWLAGHIEFLADGHADAASGIRTVDALGADGLRTCSADIVVGNPPFGSPLKQATDAESARRAAKELGGCVGRYTDLAAIFLGHCCSVVQKGGALGMVQPLSVLASRDAAPIRAALMESCTPTAAWASPARVFDADVFTCVLAFTQGPAPAAVTVNRFRDLPPQPCGTATIRAQDASWAALATAAMGFPDVPRYQSSGTIGDIAAATADFRDQYYGLKPAIVECGEQMDEGAVPVVTTGVLDPARCQWGRQPIRLFGTKWNRPGITISALDPQMQAWATGRLVPKVMLPTQTRTLEPVLDVAGRWLPSVPIITITTPDPEDLSRVAAVLACPLVSLLAIHRSLGTARSPKAIKLSASEVLMLPTPIDQDAWSEAAGRFELAQHAKDQTACDAHLHACATLMLGAYRVDKKAIGP